MARLAGFEPATSASAGLRSIQLSYRRILIPKGPWLRSLRFSGTPFNQTLDSNGAEGGI